MGRIDELVERLCPDGVELVSLNECLAYEQPTAYLVASANYSDKYDVPVLTAGQAFILGYTDETAGICDASPDDPVVIFDDFTTAFKWVDFPFKVKSSAMKILRPRSAPDVSFRYIYYAMQCIDYVPEDHRRHWIGIYSSFRIPMPPREIQEEIVRMLDSFAELEVELEAELEARKCQYTYYREELFDFSRENDVPFRKLGELGTFTRGKRFTTADYVDAGIGSIHYGEIYTSYGISATQTFSHVPEDMRSSLRFARPGDVVIAATGENVEDLCKSVAWLGKEEVAVHDDCWIFTSDINPKFVVHALLTPAVASQKKRLISNGKICRISGKKLSQIFIPVPSRARQDEVVAILDKFDIFVADGIQGIPAEIAARRKQYEYYRNRLLDFSHKEVSE